MHATDFRKYLPMMGATLVLPEGVTARAIGLGDTTAWARLMAARERVDQTGMSFAPADLADELNSPRVDPRRDTIGLWSGAEMVGFGLVYGADSVTDVDRVTADGAVHPQWRRRGLGTALMPWLIRRAGELHEDRFPGSPGELSSSAVSTNIGAQRLFDAFGFERCRYFLDMRRPLGEPVTRLSLPPGLRVMRFDPALDESLRRTHNEVFLDHWGSPPVDAATWTAWFTGSRSFRSGVSCLVLDGPTIVSYVLGYEWEADAAATGVRELYIGQVGTRRSHRGRGLAGIALAEVLARGALAGYERAGLGVDAQNPTGAVGLYERLGFSVCRTTVCYRLAL